MKKSITLLHVLEHLTSEEDIQDICHDSPLMEEFLAPSFVLVADRAYFQIKSGLHVPGPMGH